MIDFDNGKSRSGTCFEIRTHMKNSHIGEKIALLCRIVGLSQTNIAEKMKIPSTQVNRFLNGHNDVYAKNFIGILNLLDIDIEKIISDRIQGKYEIQLDPESLSVLSMCQRLDKKGKETLIGHLRWVTELKQDATWK